MFFRGLSQDERAKYGERWGKLAIDSGKVGWRNEGGEGGGVGEWGVGENGGVGGRGL